MNLKLSPKQHGVILFVWMIHWVFAISVVVYWIFFEMGDKEATYFTLLVWMTWLVNTFITSFILKNSTTIYTKEYEIDGEKRTITVITGKDVINGLKKR